MKKEHRIAYNLGITRSPSDFLCKEGEFAECINLTTDNQELKPAHQPKAIFGGVPVTDDKTEGGNKMELMFVHEFNGYKHYFFLDPQDKVLQWTEENAADNYLDFKDTGISGLDIYGIQSIGNTIIVATEKGLRYLLWKAQDEGYKYIGDRIPEPDVEFAVGMLSGSDKTSYDGLSVYSYSSYEGMVKDYLIQSGKQIDYNNLVYGLYNSNIKKLHQGKLFVNPFFVRYALKLYDGEYKYISNPILLFPSIHSNGYTICDESKLNMYMYMRGFKLLFNNKHTYKEWGDLVKGITVFVSDETEIYDTDSDAKFAVRSTVNSSEDIAFRHTYGMNVYYTNTFKSSELSEGKNYCDTMILKSDEDIIKELKSTSVFYRLGDIDISQLSGYEDAGKIFDTHTLENLTTQTELNVDDYFSHCDLIPKFIYAYNGRINLSNVSRGMFGGFNYMCPYDLTNSDTKGIDKSVIEYTSYVYIETGSGQRIVKHTWQSLNYNGIYYYYPDPRAKKVMLVKNEKKYIILELEEHSGLNGAIYLKALPGANDTEDSIGWKDLTDGTVIPTESAEPELLENKTITSEIDNPYIFKASGYNTAGTGEIKGIASTTTALSEGQFGAFPLLCFATDGIWALEVGTDGLYTSKQPISRDVCLHGKSICQTDGAIFMITKKGLMAIVGRKCNVVSGRMDGMNFDPRTMSEIVPGGTIYEEIITSCCDDVRFRKYATAEDTFIAFDYTDGRLLIGNKNYKYMYVYTINDGTVSKLYTGKKMIRAVNAYPDTLLQDTEGRVYTLYNKEEEEDVTEKCRGFALTRPLKMSDATTLKSLKEIRNYGMWDVKSGSYVKMRLYYSDNLTNWYEDTSLYGTAAKYYRIALYTNLLPCERLSGTVYVEEERNTNKLK